MGAPLVTRELCILLSLPQLCREREKLEVLHDAPLPPYPGPASFKDEQLGSSCRGLSFSTPPFHFPVVTAHAPRSDLLCVILGLHNAHDSTAAFCFFQRPTKPSTTLDMSDTGEACCATLCGGCCRST